jgi:hypothetical protein
VKGKKLAWKSFKNVITNFLGNQKAENSCDIVADLVESYKAMGFNKSLEVHFLDYHSDLIFKNLRTLSDKHREQFHQDISTTKSGTKVESQYAG